MAYTTRDNLETKYGKSNIAEWTDLDNDQDDATIAARIVAAIQYADDEIDSRIFGTSYTVPLVLRGTSTTPPVIVDIANRLAAVWLYESRGVREVDPDTGRPIHRLYFEREGAERKLKEIVSGVRRLPCTQSAAAAPEVIVDED